MYQIAASQAFLRCVFLGASVVGKPGQGNGEFQTPHGLSVDPRVERPVLTVADRGNRRIQTFTLDSNPLKTMKDEEHMRMPLQLPYAWPVDSVRRSG